MKKKRVVLFPGSEGTSVPTDNNIPKPLQEIQVGKVYKIGQPSNRYYQYIHPVLEPSTLSLKDLEDFKKIEDLIVLVISILRMSSGNRIAVLRNYKGEIFPGNIQKIFAHVDMSIKNKEIVKLDLDTKLSLDTNAN